jgi:hypothetical protein
VFRANKVEIKHKTLEALRLLRQADHALDKIHEYFDELTEYVWTWRYTDTKEECKGEIGNVQWWTDKKVRRLSESVSSSHIWVRRVLWAVSWYSGCVYGEQGT